MEQNQLNLFAKLKQYVTTWIDLIKISFIESAASLLSTVISFLLIAFLSLIVFIFLSVGLALYIGNALNHISYGFFAVTLFFALLLFILLKVKKTWIERPLINYQIKKFFRQRV